MKIAQYIILPIALLISVTLSAVHGAVRPISLQEAATQIKKASPGDTIVIQNGTYTDLHILFKGKGTEERPIVITAETPGEVFIEGESRLSITGEWLVVSGLYFRNGFSPTGTIIEYRNGSEHAYNCRVTECVIEHFNPSRRTTKGNWVQLYGRNNRFDHNSIVGKLNTGVQIAAVLNGMDDQHHRIDNNYFGPRAVHGSNGGETIRTGNSFTSRTSSYIVIEDNYFDRCSGEVEILSIKSCDNTIRRNTFFECEGGLVLRHGDRNVVESNLMIGNGKPNTGGIRIINKGHRIFNNYLVGLAGTRAFSVLSIMNGVPNSPDYRYHQVEDVEIYNNTIVDCGNILFSLGKDFERIEPPINTRFANNLIVNRQSETFCEIFDDISGIVISGNMLDLAPGADIPEGFAGVNAKEVQNSGYPVVYASEKIKPALTETTYDITGNRVRSGGYAGAIAPGNASKKIATPKKDECGATWYTYDEPMPRTVSGNVITVSSGQNSLKAALAGSRPGDVIELSAEGEYWNDASLVIPHYIILRAKPGLAKRPVLKYNGRGGEPMVTIANGGHLDLVGICFNGVPEVELTDPRCFINTAVDMIEDYTLEIDDCEFTRFNRSNFAISCEQGTFAKWVRITNSRFVNLPLDAIVFTREQDSNGRYNVESFELRNCLFANVGGRGVDLQRLGHDESTAGPNVVIEHCTFYNVFNREQGSTINLTGVQKISVTDCTFEKSGQGGASIRLSEKRWDDVNISRCNFWEAGRIFTFWNTGVKDDMTYLKPVYASPETLDFRQSPSSPLRGKATDGKDIGIN